MKTREITYNPLTKLLYIDNELVDEDYVKYINSLEPIIRGNRVLANKECWAADVKVTTVNKNILFVKVRKEPGIRISSTYYIENYLRWKGLAGTTVNISCTLAELQEYTKLQVLNHMDQASKDVIEGLKQELTKAYNENWDAQERARVKREIASEGNEF